MGIVVAAREPGLIEQTLGNQVKVAEGGKLVGAGATPVTPEQMELSKLRAENARLKMHVDIQKDATAYFCVPMRCEVRLDGRAAPRIPPARRVRSAGRQHLRLPRVEAWRQA